MERYIEMVNYQRYIQSDKWKEKRAKIIEERKQCEMCDSAENLQVHHLTYKRLGNEDDRDLMLLCQNCHQHIHTDENAIPYINIIDGTMELFSNKNYIKRFYDNQLPEVLTFVEVGKTIELMNYITKHQILKIGNCYLSEIDVMNIYKTSLRQSRSFLKLLISNNIIRHININGSECYAFNPMYALFGDRITYIAYGIFADVLKNEIPDYVKEAFEEQMRDNLTNINFMSEAITDKVEIKK